MDYTVKKSINTVRIVTLGDSHMFGWGVAEKEMYTNVLENMLNSKFPEKKWEIINTAVPGYNTYMEVETLKRKAIMYSPDIVIMEYGNLKILETFDIHSLPNLDVVVRAALERFFTEKLPVVDVHALCPKPLVVGSANAHTVGRILFKDTLAQHAEEGDFEDSLATFTDRDCVVVISASGGKHAVGITQMLAKKYPDLPVWLLTNNKDAQARETLSDDRVIVFPKNREPYTYNTSTYLSMILSQSKENPKEIYTHLDTVGKHIPKNLERYTAFILTVPSELEEVRDMFRTKFDELFGGNVTGRIFTDEEIKHAKTVVPSDKELTVHFTSDGNREAEALQRGNHIHIPLTEHVQYGEMIAVGYFVIGKIQEAHPAYFKENIVAYTKDASKIFNQTINPIVE